LAPAARAGGEPLAPPKIEAGYLTDGEGRDLELLVVPSARKPSRFDHS
jgi:hypothetical protein